MLKYCIVLLTLVSCQVRRDQSGLDQGGASNPLVDQHAVLMVIDTSGSMDDRMTTKGKTQAKFDFAWGHFSELFRKLSKDPKKHVGVIGFSKGPALIREMATTNVVTMELQSIEKTLNQIRGGGTPLAESIKMAATLLKNKPARSKSLIILTDGMDNLGHQNLVDAIEYFNREVGSEVQLHLYGLGLDARTWGSMKGLDQIIYHGTLWLIDRNGNGAGPAFELTYDAIEGQFTKAQLERRVGSLKSSGQISSNNVTTGGRSSPSSPPVGRVHADRVVIQKDQSGRSAAKEAKFDWQRLSDKQRESIEKAIWQAEADYVALRAELATYVLLATHIKAPTILERIGQGNATMGNSSSGYSVAPGISVHAALDALGVNSYREDPSSAGIFQIFGMGVLDFFSLGVLAEYDKKLGKRTWNFLSSGSVAANVTSSMMLSVAPDIEKDNFLQIEKLYQKKLQSGETAAELRMIRPDWNDKQIANAVTNLRQAESYQDRMNILFSTNGFGRDYPEWAKKRIHATKLLHSAQAKALISLREGDIPGGLVDGFRTFPVKRLMNPDDYVDWIHDAMEHQVASRENREMISSYSEGLAYYTRIDNSYKSEDLKYLEQINREIEASKLFDRIDQYLQTTENLKITLTKLRHVD